MRKLSPIVFVLLLSPSIASAYRAQPEEEIEKRARLAAATRTPGTDQAVRLTAELATALSRGNTETFLLSTNGSLTWAFAERWVSETRIRALYEESFGANSANNWGAFERVDRFISQRFSAFAGAGVERDPFAGLDSRVSGQLGMSFLALELRDLSREDLVTDKITVELGAYAANEQYRLSPNAPADAVLETDEAEIYAGRAAAGYTHAFQRNASTGIALELIQDFNDLDRLFINGSVFVGASITDGLTLKTTLSNRYVRKPASEELKKNDLLLTAGIVVSI